MKQELTCMFFASLQLDWNRSSCKMIHCNRQLDIQRFGHSPEETNYRLQIEIGKYKNCKKNNHLDQLNGKKSIIFKKVCSKRNAETFKLIFWYTQYSFNVFWLILIKLCNAQWTMNWKSANDRVYTVQK